MAPFLRDPARGGVAVPHRRCMTIAPANHAPRTGSEARPKPRLRRVCYEPEPGSTAAVPLPRTPEPPPVPVPSVVGVRELAEAHRAVSRILRIALEVLERRRPSTQLERYFAPAPLRCWRVAVRQRRPRSRVQPGRMRVCMPRTEVAEVALPCTIDGRVRALAARFEHSAAGWRCTAIRLG
jgi:hypothetical protein